MKNKFSSPIIFSPYFLKIFPVLHDDFSKERIYIFSINVPQRQFSLFYGIFNPGGMNS